MGKMYEEKTGRQYADAMTVAKAKNIRSDRIRGKVLSRKEIREKKRTLKEHEKNKMTIGRLWETYQEHQPNYRSYSSDVGRYHHYIEPKLGNKQPMEVGMLEVDRLRINLLKEKSPQTVKHVLGLLKRIVNFGKDRGLCEGFSFKVTMPKVNNLRTEDLSPAELSRLLEAIDEDENIAVAKLMKLALFTGMRKGELFKLKRVDIDYERNFITLEDPKGGPTQKIPMNDEARKILESIPQTKSLYIFPGRNGGQRTNISKPANRIKKRAGLPKDFRPLHGLRHVYASMLASSGKVDLYVLQKLLCHKSPQMTQRYSHLRDEALKKASDVAADIISQAVNGKYS